MSETDTEVIAHAIDLELQSNIPLIESVQKAVRTLKGSYGLGIISSNHPDQIIAARKYDNVGSVCAVLYGHANIVDGYC